MKNINQLHEKINARGVRDLAYRWINEPYKGPTKSYYRLKRYHAQINNEI